MYNKILARRGKKFGKNVEFKRFLSNAGTRPFSSFRSGIYGRKLSRHRGRDNVLCVVLSVKVLFMCCGSVQGSRASFMVMLQELL